MKVLKHVNNISEELRQQIPILESGTVARFKMLTGVKNNDPNIEFREKRPVFYGCHQIPCQDRIRDPFSTNTNHKYVEIGVVKDFDISTERVISWKCFVPGSNITVPGLWNGDFCLEGGKIDDEELFEYLWLTNYRKDAPNRDERINPMFEFIEFNKEGEVAKPSSENKKGRKPKHEAVV